MDPALELADYRRRVVLLHLTEPRTGREGVEAFREERDRLFREHPQSALTDEQRVGFQGLSYFPYDPEAVIGGGSKRRARRARSRSTQGARTA